ncbi:hypothetical protein L9F63_007013, partial [Diploptera punctata]
MTRGWCSEDEERLVRDLFRGYNKLIRPVQNMTQKVDVRFGLAFVQLINVVSPNVRILCSNECRNCVIIITVYKTFLIRGLPQGQMLLIDFSQE